MAPSIWLAQLHISPRVAHKISTLHGLQEESLRDALVCVPGLVFTWHEHPQRGRRALIDLRVDGARVLVVLYPAGGYFADEWNLGSAYRI